VFMENRNRNPRSDEARGPHAPRFITSRYQRTKPSTLYSLKVEYGARNGRRWS
jgi:hypothetical protein